MLDSQKTPVVSVIMPVYNAEKYLRQSIDSILRQTYTDFEFIIVNDGSSDKSWDIIQEYAKRDERIVAIDQQNSGVVATANHAAEIAKGVYLARTDADDVSFDTKLNDLILCATRNPEAIVITGSIEVINEKDEFIYRELVPTYSDDIKRAMYVRNPIPNGATLVKKESFDKVGGFADVFAEDFHLWTRLWFEGEFAATGTTVYRWRMNSTGLTFTNNQTSMQKEKEYLASIWEKARPTILSRKQILTRSRQYLALPSRFNIDYKLAFLNDLSRVSIHVIKHGNFLKGLWQLFLIASTGRTGVKIVFDRFALIISGRRNKGLVDTSSTVATHEEGLEDRSNQQNRPSSQ